MTIGGKYYLAPVAGQVLLEEAVVDTTGQVILPSSAQHRLAPVYRALSGEYEGQYVVLAEPPERAELQWPVFTIGDRTQIIVPEEAVVGTLQLLEGV